MQNYLSHHGIKGQKWGVWNETTKARYLGSRQKAAANISNSKVGNLTKWGTDEDHNILFMTGYSGSGKTTSAARLSDKDTNVIHLDFYLEGGHGRTANAMQDKEFNSFLKNNPSAFDNYNSTKLPSKMTAEERKDHWKSLDAFEDQVKAFGREQYKRGKRVVVEGVQLADQTIFPDKTYFKDQPVMILGTDIETSTKRGNKRDGISQIDIIAMLTRKSHQEFWSKRLDELGEIADVKAGEIFTKDLVQRLR